MSKYEHSAELGWKVDSEGGLPEFVFGYGVSIEDLPEDTPTPIRAYFRQILAVTPAIEAVEKYLDKAVSDYADEHPEEFA